VRHLPTRRALRLLPSAIRGAHVGRPEVTMAGGTRVRITSDTFSLPVQADGEGLTLTAREVHVDIEPGALRALTATTPRDDVRR
jgi:diacylglycerol kinase family enzyme